MQAFGSPDALAWLATQPRSGSVELKTLLEPPAAAPAEALTGRRAPTWSERRMYLLDSPALDLLAAGVELRLRGRTRGRHDLAVRTRQPWTRGCGTVPPGVRTELDLVPGGLWRELEVRCEVDPEPVAAVLDGAAARALLSGAQVQWARHNATRPVVDAALAALRVHGPVVVHRVKVAAAPGLGRTELEHLCYPTGRELLEVSTRCRPPDAPAVAAAFTRLLGERGVAVSPVHRTRPATWWEELGPA